MRTLAYIWLVIFISGCSALQFKEVALYDKWETPPDTQTEQIVYNEAKGTLWNSLFECGDFEITNQLAHSGNSCIKISWAKDGCEWIGFGNSFNDWNPVDLSEDRFNKALSLYVRTQHKTARSVPIVANLEDYQEGGSYHFIGSPNYLSALQVDTNWTQMIVPLWHFPIDEEMVNISSIKQMKFQLEGSGSFYLDDICIIDYSEEEYQTMLANVEAMKPRGNTSQNVIGHPEFDFEFDVWGQENNPCQQLIEATDPSGERYIEWEFLKTDCNWNKWGVNWNGWYPINFRGILESSKIRLKFKQSEGANFKLMLKDFRWKSTEVFDSSSSDSSTWQTVEIPLASLALDDKGFQLDQIREFTFQGENPGNISIKELKIIN